MRLRLYQNKQRSFAMQKSAPEGDTFTKMSHCLSLGENRQGTVERTAIEYARSGTVIFEASVALGARNSK